MNNIKSSIARQECMMLVVVEKQDMTTSTICAIAPWLRAISGTKHGHLNRDDVPGGVKLEEGGLTELRGYAEIIHCKSASRRCISLWIAGSDMDNAVAFAICRQTVSYILKIK